jgi:hypothetical protein
MICHYTLRHYTPILYLYIICIYNCITYTLWGNPTHTQKTPHLSHIGAASLCRYPCNSQRRCRMPFPVDSRPHVCTRSTQPAPPPPPPRCNARGHPISSCARTHMLHSYSPKLGPPRRRGDGDAAPAAAGDTAVSASKCMLKGTTCAVHDTDKGGRSGHATNMIRAPLQKVRKQAQDCIKDARFPYRAVLHVCRGDNWWPLLMHACDRNCYLRRHSFMLCGLARMHSHVRAPEMKFELKFDASQVLLTHATHNTR